MVLDILGVIKRLFTLSSYNLTFQLIIINLIIVFLGLVFLTYFGARFGIESRKRTEALNKLELILAKEHELESIGLQAAAAAHSLGTPLSTINVIARELKKEIGNDPKYSKDVDLLLSQTKRTNRDIKPRWHEIGM